MKRKSIKWHVTTKYEHEDQEKYSLEFVEDGLAGAAVVEELLTDLVDDVFDDVDVDAAGRGSGHCLFSSPRLVVYAYMYVYVGDNPKPKSNGRWWICWSFGDGC